MKNGEVPRRLFPVPQRTASTLPRPGRKHHDRKIEAGLACDAGAADVKILTRLVEKRFTELQAPWAHKCHFRAMTDGV